MSLNYSRGFKVALTGLACLALVGESFGQETKNAKTFIDYFLPTPLVGALS